MHDVYSQLSELERLIVFEEVIKRVFVFIGRYAVSCSKPFLNLANALPDADRWPGALLL